ncbi:MAG: hypothetical protein M1837_000894 [Sclerophora amabilis]|nr:MAG: hypothetical protein M1837_000894 [Sclerophora amabilis]
MKYSKSSHSSSIPSDKGRLAEEVPVHNRTDDSEETQSLVMAAQQFTDAARRISEIALQMRGLLHFHEPQKAQGSDVCIQTPSSLGPIPLACSSDKSQKTQSSYDDGSQEASSLASSANTSTTASNTKAILEKPVGVPLPNDDYSDSSVASIPTGANDAEQNQTNFGVVDIDTCSLVRFFDLGLRSLVTRVPKRAVRGHQIFTRRSAPTLAAIAPTLWSPGYLPDVALRAAYTSSIARSACSMSACPSSSTLVHKLSKLTKMRLSPIVNTDFEEPSARPRLRDVVEARLWRMLQKKMYDPGAARALQPFELPREVEQEIEGDDVLEPLRNFQMSGSRKENQTRLTDNNGFHIEHSPRARRRVNATTSNDNSGINTEHLPSSASGHGPGGNLSTFSDRHLEDMARDYDAYDDDAAAWLSQLESDDEYCSDMGDDCPEDYGSSADPSSNAAPLYESHQQSEVDILEDPELFAEATCHPRSSHDRRDGTTHSRATSTFSEELVRTD